MTHIRICIAGSTGRMGAALIKEAEMHDFEIVGAIAATGELAIGRTLSQLGLGSSEVTVMDPTELREALSEADVYMTFTQPDAEVRNLPLVAEMGKKIVMGTTGFTKDQKQSVEESVQGKVPAVFAPNFSIGVNILYRLVQECQSFPEGYDFSIFEAHHAGKQDAPSGTAIKLSEIVSKLRGYEEVIYDRKKAGRRHKKELEVLSARAGGIPGLHTLLIAGPHEALRIEHLAFSRNVFAQGALYAAEWIYKQREPKIYSMEDVLS